MKPTTLQGLSSSSCHCVIVTLEVLPANEPALAAQPSLSAAYSNLTPQPKTLFVWVHIFQFV